MKLRASTGAGMMDSKNALEEAGGDMDKAAEILRKKGVIKAAKRADRIAADGMIVVAVNADNTVGAVVEVNSETDFVAKSGDFIDFTKHVATAAVESAPADLAALLAVKLPSGMTVEETQQHVTLKTGEKVAARRFARFAGQAGKVYSYLHGTKIGVLVELAGGDAETGTDVAMHIAASNPKYLKREDVPAALVETEKAIYADQLAKAGKPANIIENILKGKLDKFYGEICAPEQVYIKNEELTVQKYLDSKKASLVRFARFELGEGIEKVTKDFAAEVAEQLK